MFSRAALSGLLRAPGKRGLAPEVRFLSSSPVHRHVLGLLPACQHSAGHGTGESTAGMLAAASSGRIHGGMEPVAVNSRRIAWMAAATPAAVAPDAVADGVWQAIALVGASELGDKTFFLSALIAMRAGRSVAFTGSLSALSVLTAASVGLGQAFRYTPDFLATGLPVGDMLATSMFSYFGIQMLREARMASLHGASEEAKEEAEEDLAAREKSEGGDITSRWWAAFAAAFSLVFVAEIGDKSMFATIALAREFNPWGVLLGAMIGHCMATGLAVLGGSAMNAHMSQATIGYVGGSLFLVFAAYTAWEVYSSWNEKTDE